MEREEFLVAARIESHRLDAWIAEGWLMSGQSTETASFTEIDLARACLIRDLCELGVNEDAIPIILDLVDQVHGLRCTLRDLLARMRAQSEAPGTR